MSLDNIQAYIVSITWSCSFISSRTEVEACGLQCLNSETGSLNSWLHQLVCHWKWINDGRFVQLIILTEEHLAINLAWALSRYPHRLRVTWMVEQRFQNLPLKTNIACERQTGQNVDWKSSYRLLSNLITIIFEKKSHEPLIHHISHLLKV